MLIIALGLINEDFLGVIKWECIVKCVSLPIVIAK